jgi:hypothetical protein
MLPLDLLGDVDQVEARFCLFADTINLDGLRWITTGMEIFLPDPIERSLFGFGNWVTT